MKKRLQNRIAESRLTLPSAIVYATACWILCGLFPQNMWIQAGCFGLTTFCMLMLNNTNALIRIYSRMVSSAFLILSCMLCFLFNSVAGNVSQLFFAASYLILFFTYQDTNSPGFTYYGFLLFGLATIASVHLLYLLPVLWILMVTNLQSFSWRTFMASLMGVATPYWVVFCLGVYQQDLSFFVNHFQPFIEFHTPFNLSILDINRKIILFFLVVMAIVSTLHFWQTSYLDKFRIRMLYGLFIRMDFALFLYIILQPQLYDILIRLLIINTAPLIAHFFALTKSKFTNILFIIVMLAVGCFTAYNVWMSSSLF